MSTKTISRPVLVRNTKLGPTVFRDDTSNSEVTWKGAADPMGEDVQPVPQNFLENNQFLLSLSRGTFVVESAPEDIIVSLAEYLDDPSLKRQAAQLAAKQDAAANTALETVDHKSNNDIVTVKCIGPSTRGDGECGVEIPVRELGKGDRAPLCAQHASLAPQYIPTEAKDATTGKPVQTWVRAALAERQQYQSVID